MDEKYIARFWPKVDKSGDCWIWTAAKDTDGYGIFQMARRARKAHRLSYELASGKDPGNLCVCHRCDNPPCVNPDHLFLGTVGDNTRDMVAKGRNPDQRGEFNRSAKLSEVDVRAIQDAVDRGEIQRVVGERFGITQGTVSRLAHGVRWPHLNQTHGNSSSLASTATVGAVDSKSSLAKGTMR